MVKMPDLDGNLQLSPEELDRINEVGYDLLKLRKEIKQKLEDNYKNYYIHKDNNYYREDGKTLEYAKVVGKFKIKLYNFINSHAPGGLRWLPTKTNADLIKDYAEEITIASRQYDRIVAPLRKYDLPSAIMRLLPPLKVLTSSDYPYKIMKKLRLMSEHDNTLAKLDSMKSIDQDLVYKMYKEYEEKLLVSLSFDKWVVSRLKDLADKHEYFIPEVEDSKLEKYQKFLMFTAPTALRCVFAHSTRDIMDTPELDAGDIYMSTEKFNNRLQQQLQKRGYEQRDIETKLEKIIKNNPSYSRFIDDDIDDIKRETIKAYKQLLKLKKDLFEDNKSLITTMLTAGGLLPEKTLTDTIKASGSTPSEGMGWN